jgi:hypothetical protein
MRGWSLPLLVAESSEATVIHFCEFRQSLITTVHHANTIQQHDVCRCEFIRLYLTIRLDLYKRV